MRVLGDPGEQGLSLQCLGSVSAWWELQGAAVARRLGEMGLGEAG